VRGACGTGRDGWAGRPGIGGAIIILALARMRNWREELIGQLILVREQLP
jgi:hypothetical protein